MATSEVSGSASWSRDVTHTWLGFGLGFGLGLGLGLGLGSRLGAEVEVDVAGGGARLVRLGLRLALGLGEGLALGRRAWRVARDQRPTSSPALAAAIETPLLALQGPLPG